MASDRAFEVTWRAGRLLVYGKDERSAIEVAIEYLRVVEAHRIVARPLDAREAHEDAIRPGDAQV
jgi:hypothetical protein